MKKAVKIAIWIFIVLLLVGSGAAFYILHSDIWKNSLAAVLHKQLESKYQLDLSIEEISGSPFGSLQFKSLNLATFNNAEILYIGKINLEFGLIPLIFQKGTINYLGIDSLFFSYPGSIDTLKSHLSLQNRSASGKRLEFQKIEITKLIIHDSNNSEEELVTSQAINGSCLFTPESISIFVEDAGFFVESFNEKVTMQNTAMSLISDSLVIHECQLKNRSTELGLCGYVKLDSGKRFNLDCRAGRIIFRERFPEQQNIFSKNDYLDIVGNVNNEDDFVQIDFRFNGVYQDNKITKGVVKGSIDQGDYSVSEFFCRSGEETITGSGKWNAKSGLFAQIGIDGVNLEKWNVLNMQTRVNGLVSVNVDGNLFNPNSIITKINFNHTRFDTLLVNSMEGKFIYANGRIETVDTVRAFFEDTKVKLEGWGNLDSNTVNARVYFNSRNVLSLSELAGIGKLKGGLEGFLEATGKIRNPDFRGWIRGRDIGVSNMYFEDAVARFGLLNIREKHFGDIYVEATNGITPLLNDTIPMASMIVSFENDTAIVRSLRIVGEDLNVEIQGKMIEFTDLYFDRIEADKQGNSIRNIDPIHFSWNADTISLDEVRFSLNGGMLIVSGDAVNRRIKSLIVNISDLNIDPFNSYLRGPRGVTGVLNGLISYVDTSGVPAVYSRIDIKDANLFGNNFNIVRLESRIAQNRIKLENILFEDVEKGFMNGYGTLGCNFPLTEGFMFIDSTDSIDIQMVFENFAFNIFDPFLLPGKSKDGKMFGSLNINGLMNDPVFKYQLKIMDPVFDRLSGDELQVKGEYKNSKLEFADIMLRDEKGLCRGSGYLPYNFKFIPRHFILEKDSSMYMNFSLHTSGLKFLSEYVKIFESIDGEYNLALSLSGTPNNPIRSGNVIVRNGVVQLRPLENPITGLEGSAIMRNNTMEIVSLSGYMQKPVSRTRIDKFRRKLSSCTWDILFPPSLSSNEPNVSIAGTLDFTKFFRPAFDIQVTGKEMYIRTLLAEQEGIVDGQFSVIGGDTLNIEGNVDINEFIIRNEFGSSEQLLKKVLPSKTYTNINLHTIIPGNLYFRNSQLDCELEGEMWIIKHGADPYRFSGTLDIRKGKFIYYGWEFEVVHGTVIFDPTEFNPILDIEAKVNLASYVQSDTMTTQLAEDDYVVIRLSGDLQNPTLEFDSGNKYNESDILMFLTRTGGPFNQDRLSADVINVFGLYFKRQFEKNISRISGLDEFELRTRGNLLSNRQPDQWSFVIGQKIRPNLYLKYERALSLIEPNQQLGVEYRLSRNISIVGDINQDGLLSINYIYKYRY
ncbi:MAG: translocation/assembly module TamB domain-containing protein [Candidatus Marinimicrobia bacterium]|nr:translocation/assembly module TamB domain-containing protein [Candidatus Neomarinimicrobiota bacterium]